MQLSDRIRHQFADIMGGSSMFAGTRTRDLVRDDDDSNTPIFHSEINPDPYSFSPSASLAARPDLPLAQLDGQVLSPGSEVDPYNLSASESEQVAASTNKSQKVRQDSHSPGEEPQEPAESGTERKNRSRTAHPSTTAAKRTRTGAGWWAHQSIFPSGLLSSSSTRSNSRNLTSSRRSEARRSQRRDLDAVYNSDEESDGSETSMSSGNKASDPPSPSSSRAMDSRTIRHSRSGRSHQPRHPHRHSRGIDHSASDPPYTSDTESDFSSGSSLASTSTASGLLSPSEDIGESLSPNSRSHDRARADKRSSGRSSRIHRERIARKARVEDGDMLDPEFGERDLESLTNAGAGVIPDRLEIYQDKFGPWTGAASFRKYKGGCCRRRGRSAWGPPLKLIGDTLFKMRRSWHYGWQVYWAL
ncbi:hypothetical protein QFC21_003970 [Naganishia friedmannii]|uniref:Uncharacterized protein n=1 Tax=Naganishia friedmannii TaxID=89922 RepID=A0ACC2VN34_9TREE|nr:hypothetical protein QFC21_003970 [Naganishia friedmannii]